MSTETLVPARLSGSLPIECTNCRRIDLANMVGWIAHRCTGCGQTNHHPMMKQRGGRPAHGTRSEKIQTVLSEKQATALRMAALGHGTTPSQMIRMAVSSMLQVPE